MSRGEIDAFHTGGERGMRLAMGGAGFFREGLVDDHEAVIVEEAKEEIERSEDDRAFTVGIENGAKRARIADRAERRERGGGLEASNGVEECRNAHIIDTHAILVVSLARGAARLERSRESKGGSRRRRWAGGERNFGNRERAGWGSDRSVSAKRRKSGRERRAEGGGRKGCSEGSASRGRRRGRRRRGWRESGSSRLGRRRRPERFAERRASDRTRRIGTTRVRYESARAKVRFGHEGLGARKRARRGRRTRHGALVRANWAETRGVRGRFRTVASVVTGGATSVAVARGECSEGTGRETGNA